jgi:hypothetical protein
MEFAVLAALALKVTDFLKYLTNRHWNSAITQGTVWLAGVLVVFLGASADLTAGIEVFGSALGDIDAASLLLLGLGLGSTGSVAYDFKAALDNSDTAITPSLTNKP